MANNPDMFAFPDAISRARTLAKSEGRPFYVYDCGPAAAGHIHWACAEWTGAPCERGRILILPDGEEFPLIDGQPRALSPERVASLKRYLRSR